MTDLERKMLEKVEEEVEKRLKKEIGRIEKEVNRILKKWEDERTIKKLKKEEERLGRARVKLEKLEKKREAKYLETRKM